MNINVSIARSVYFDTRCKYHVNFLHILIQIITCCSELWFGCWKHESKFNDGELKRVWKSCNRWHICVYKSSWCEDPTFALHFQWFDPVVLKHLGPYSLHKMIHKLYITHSCQNPRYEQLRQEHWSIHTLHK